MSTNFNGRTSRERNCCEMKDQLKTDPDFLSRIITGDESWCYDFFLFPRMKRDLKGKRF